MKDDFTGVVLILIFLLWCHTSLCIYTPCTVTPHVHKIDNYLSQPFQPRTHTVQNTRGHIHILCFMSIRSFMLTIPL
jgi:hypothetical protein